MLVSVLRKKGADRVGREKSGNGKREESECISRDAQA